MKIAVIQASSQKDKNSIIYDTLIKVVKDKGYEVINFGVFYDEIIPKIDVNFMKKVINRRNVFDYVMKYGQDVELMKLLEEY
ncbi:MAG: hypothetical protein ACI33I_12250 [Clostridium sp.]